MYILIKSFSNILVINNDKHKSLKGFDFGHNQTSDIGVRTISGTIRQVILELELFRAQSDK